MKKTTITFLMSAFLAMSQVKAQSVQEGYTHLNADRFKSAIAVFEKILATNPNNIEATYWLGQTYLDMDDNDAARQLYSKGLQASANAPLLLVGMGHVDLLDKKTSDARQKFESALTMTRSTKKGDDPVILTAIGRANVDAKAGDFVYAIEKLEAAVLKDPKNPEIYLQLGNAYRKARPGEGGGKGFENYKKALEVSPGFSVACVRLAKLFESQKNWELVLQFLNEAITRDPKFSPAYYELFYYNFFRQNYPEAETQLKKYIDSKLPETDIQDEFLYAQLCWARKDFNCAISKAQGVNAAMGIHTKPRVYKLLADAYYQKGDYSNAKKSIDEYFSKEKPEGVIAFDYKLKVDILSQLGTSCEELYSVYMTGAAFDTVLQSRIDYLTIAADSFKVKNCKKQEGDMRVVIYKLRPRPQPGGLINIGIVYSQAGELIKADSIFKVYADIMPDSIYGYDWRARVNLTLDSTMVVEPYATAMVQGFQKSLDIATTDKIRFKTQGIRAALTLAGYYNNIKNDRATALSYIMKGLDIDSSNQQLKGIKDIFTKTPATKTPAPKGNSLPNGSKEIKDPGSKTFAARPKTTSTAKVVIKK